MPDPIRVVIADDSAFARLIVAKTLGADSSIEIVASAEDGQQAIAMAREFRPDVMTLDIEMPLMDGLSALARLMAENPTPVVMLSTLGTDPQFVKEASELGAVTFLSKSAITRPDEERKAPNLLIAKVRAAAKTAVKRKARPTRAPTRAPSGRRSSRLRRTRLGKVIVIGSSTGGPKALLDLFSQLPAHLNAGILLVQHMPPTFTESLAERLDTVGSIRVKEAEDGDNITLGNALLAPGNFHMVVNPDGTVSLNQNPPLSGVRPAIDVTLSSAAEAYGPGCLGVILTGMGSDGTRGAQLVKAVGGKVAAEHQSSCVVYGMPRSIIEAGLADIVAPLPRMAEELVKFAS